MNNNASHFISPKSSLYHYKKQDFTLTNTPKSNNNLGFKINYKPKINRSSRNMSKDSKTLKVKILIK
jgi:hypothetical protein